MRSTAKWIWLGVFITFVGGFLLAESSGLLSRGPNTATTVVASVNGRDIPLLVWERAIEARQEQESQKLGRALTLDEQEALKQEVFDNMVNQILLEQEYAHRHIVATDNEIIEAARTSPPPEFMQAPELQTEGHFDPEKYQRFLSSPMAQEQGVRVQLEAMYRAEIPKEKLFEQVALDMYLTDDQLWNIWQDTHDSAQMSWVSFQPGMVPDSAIHISDAEVKKYYDAHHDVLEQKGVAVLSLLMIPRSITATDSAAALSHILDLRRQITNGSSFTDIAKQESTDSASAIAGGSLGWGKKGRFVPTFEKAAWSLKPGEISQPVLTPYGYHLIRMDSASGDSAKFSHILVKIQQSDSSASRTNAIADSLEKLTSEGENDPTTFDKAAKTLGLTSQRVKVIEGAPVYAGARQVPSVGTWAFSGVQRGAISDLIDADQAYYLARIDSLAPGGLPSLANAQPRIRALLGAEKALDLLMPRAQAFAQQAARISLDQAADSQHLRVNQTPTFTPTAFVPDIGHLNQAVGAAFTIPVGMISQPIQTGDGVFVIRVNKRVLADKAEWAKQKDQQRQVLMATLRQQQVRNFLDDLRKAAKIVDNRAAIEAANRKAMAS